MNPVDLYLNLGLDLYSVYLLWLYAAAIVLLSLGSRSRKFTIVGDAGIFIAVEAWHWDKGSLQEIFYGGWPDHTSDSASCSWRPQWLWGFSSV